MKKIFSIAFVLLLLTGLQSAKAELTSKERNILANKAKEINLASSLLPDNSWIKTPGYKDRAFWQNLPESVRRDYIENAEKYLSYDWPAVKATDYLEIIRSGDRRQGVFAAVSNALTSLVMGELVEGKGRFMDQIINGVWFYCEQTWWGWSAHLGHYKAQNGLPDINNPYIDLGVGEVAGNLSWTYYLLKDEFNKVHPTIAARLKQELENKAIKPYFEHDDFGYMGFKGGRPNNWNPWINYNMLTCFLLIESDPNKRVAEVQKVINSLDKFLNGYSDDGGCDEGPSYWGAAGALLFESLDILDLTTKGKFNVYNNALIKNIGNYFYKVNIHAPYFINFADADATTGGNASAVYRYGKAIGDPTMQQFGAYLAKLNKFGEKAMGGKVGDQVRNLTLIKELQTAPAKEALVSDFWLPDTEVAGARDKADSYKGFFFGAKGGFNAESHNHNDVGSALMYYDGKPCLVDLGREEYTAKTFSSRRYEIWTMQSKFHNLAIINGKDQKDGANFKARKSTFTANAQSATFSTDIAGAYPQDANVASWTRSYTLNRGKNFIVRDKYDLKAKTGPCSATFITCCAVKELKPGLLQLDGDGFSMEMKYDPKLAKANIQYIEVKDRSLKRYWPKGVTHIQMEFLSSSTKGSFETVFAPVKK